jgi:hypothetical protein
VERQPGVDDVFDDQDVAALDRRVEVLDQAYGRRATRLLRRVPGELDEVDVVQKRQCARKVGDEDEARLQRADEQRLATLVVGGDRCAQLRDAGRDLIRREVDLSDAPRVVFQTAQEASFSPYR